MGIVCATNTNRAYMAKNQDLSAGAFESHIADFSAMPMGSVQVVWRNVTGTFDGVIKLYASNLPESSDLFDGGLIDGAEIAVNNANGNCLWIRDRLAFRYLVARFEPNGITGGEVDIVALGKKT